MVFCKAESLAKGQTVIRTSKPPCVEMEKKGVER